MIKTLIITSYTTFPVTSGGQIRTYELAYGLSLKGFDVTIISPSGIFANKKLQKLSSTLKWQQVPYPFLGDIPWIGNIIFPRMFSISFHRYYHILIKKLMKESHLIIFEQASFGDIVKYIDKSKKIIFNAHNVESDYAQIECKFSLIRKIVQKRIFFMEKILIDRANITLVCSQVDKERMIHLYNVNPNKIAIVPNGIHLEKNIATLSEAEIEKKFPTLLKYSTKAIFSGSNVEHNRIAVQFIIDMLVPKIQDCAFIIQGSCGINFTKHNFQNLFIDLLPGSVKKYKGTCSVALNCVQEGSGTSLKILDYLSCHLPVISTKIGVRGYEDLEKYITVCPLENFVLELSKKQSFHPLIEKKLKNYSWDIITSKLEKICLSL